MNRTLFTILLSLLLLSCAGPKQLAYLQDLRDADNLSMAQVEAYRLRAGDQLTIRVSSFDNSAVAPFNVQNAALQDIPYIIDSEGQLTFPGIGTIVVAGETIQQLTEQLTAGVSQMAKGAVVRVELVSAIVSVLGEVYHPTRIRWYQPGLTLAEALTDAGDLRPNASRQVVVLRQQQDGIRSFVVDLTKKDCLSSPAWQLLPGDVVYVAPRRGRLIYK